MGMVKPINVRWVGRNKGTVDAPKYRCRLVAKQLATSARNDIFAATPSLEAFNTLLSIMACSPGHKMGIVDISKAFLYARIRDKVFIELPEEDPEYEKGWLDSLNVPCTARATPRGRGASIYAWSWKDSVFALGARIHVFSCTRKNSFGSSSTLTIWNSSAKMPRFDG